MAKAKRKKRSSKKAATKDRRARTRRARRTGGRALDRLMQPRRIEADLKGLTQAVEPPRDADPAKLDAVFRTKLDAALADLKAQGTPFKFVEGFRTTQRQQWLFGSGRPDAVPFGRPGPIVTNADGVNKKSNHQGTSGPGSGKAADCYPLKDGKVFIPPNTDPLWGKYAAAVVNQGLVAGHNFPNFKDSPHCELPRP